MLVNDNQSSNEDVTNKNFLLKCILKKENEIYFFPLFNEQTTQNSVPAIEDETDKPVVVDSEGHIENEEEQVCFYFDLILNNIIFEIFFKKRVKLNRLLKSR